MTKLTAARRKGLPSKDFALPGKGKGLGGKGSGAYPIQDASHARSALRLSSRFASPAEKSRIRAAVKRKYPNIGKKL